MLRPGAHAVSVAELSLILLIGPTFSILICTLVRCSQARSHNQRLSVSHEEHKFVAALLGSNDQARDSQVTWSSLDPVGSLAIGSVTAMSNYGLVQIAQSCFFLALIPFRLLSLIKMLLATSDTWVNGLQNSESWQYV